MSDETTADDIFKMIKDEGVEYVDIRFCDLPGIVQHFSIPAKAFDESVFEDGLAFDGSSIRGFQSIDESDMMLLPDPTTARIDPFRHAKTLNISFFVHDPFTREPYSRDPRNVARKAENYLKSTGIADTAYFGAEAEFYIFDSVRYDSQINSTFYEVDSESGYWNSGELTEPDGSPNRGYKVRPKGGYFPVAP
ncbi:MAG: glutamine synthetase, partial [Mycobacterium sp.]|nr:glutamine synthetase [Mycobacterium sp.]